MPEELLPEPPEARFTRWLENLQVDLAESVGGVVLRGARPVAVGVTNGATRKPTTSPGALVGFSLRNRSEADDAIATVLYHDGGDDQADVILEVTLQPGESARDWFGPGGINLAHGLFMSIDGGEVSGSVYLRGVE